MSRRLNHVPLLVLVLASCALDATGHSPLHAESLELHAGAAAVAFDCDDDMVIAGGIGPGKATGQEGRLGACATVLELSGQAFTATSRAAPARPWSIRPSPCSSRSTAPSDGPLR